MRAHLAQLGLIVWVMGAGACTSWSRLGDDQPIPARGTVQVWSAGHNMLLCDARRLGDSLVGRRPVPDTTRLVLALSSFDSVRTQTPDFGKMLILGTGVGIALFYAYVNSPEGE